MAGNWVRARLIKIIIFFLHLFFIFLFWTKKKERETKSCSDKFVLITSHYCEVQLGQKKAFAIRFIAMTLV